jgi:hypothetical protein
MAYPLMPKATAVWLVENTSLTFEQNLLGKRSNAARTTPRGACS